MTFDDFLTNKKKLEFIIFEFAAEMFLYYSSVLNDKGDMANGVQWYTKDR